MMLPTDRKNIPTAALCGLGADVPVRAAAWWVVCSFDPDELRDRANCAAMTNDLRESFGTGCAVAVPSGGRLYVLVDPANEDALTGAERLISVIAQDGYLDDDLYWQMLDALVVKLWADMPLPQRIALLQRFGVPVQHALIETPPDDQDLMRDLEQLALGD